MEKLPPGLATELQELARCTSEWLKAQALADEKLADSWFGQAQACYPKLASAFPGVVPTWPTHQVIDVAVTAAAVTLCQAFRLPELKGCLEDAKAAVQPCPPGLHSSLWKRTQDLFWASARMACAEVQGKQVTVQQEKRVFHRHARALVGLRRIGSSSTLSTDATDFSAETEKVLPSTVVMLSTEPLARERTPRSPYANHVQGKCTELLLKALDELEGRSWVEVLWAMRRLNRASDRPKEQQVPVLSCSRRLVLSDKFKVRRESGRRRALLVGIDYAKDPDVAISHGRSQVKAMQAFLQEKSGFEDIRVLVDDGEADTPTKAKIEKGMKWLVTGAQPGDSLLFQYCGHGYSQRTSTASDAEPAFDQADDPELGCDEALCPVDFRSAGMLFDDEVYRHLIAPLPRGVLLTCIIDCCQSGTILHLPYAYRADQDAESLSGSDRDLEVMTPNEDYDPGLMLQVIQTHPAMCAAASIWAKELQAMGQARTHDRGPSGSILEQIAQSGKAWAEKGR